jgi:hypothetical protein
MADTVVNTPSGTRDTSDSSAAGWIVALVVLAVIVLGALVWARRGIPAPTNPGTNINVTAPTTPGTGGTGGGGTGGTGGTTY